MKCLLYGNEANGIWYPGRSIIRLLRYNISLAFCTTLLSILLKQSIFPKLNYSTYMYMYIQYMYLYIVGHEQILKIRTVELMLEHLN